MALLTGDRARPDPTPVPSPSPDRPAITGPDRRRPSAPRRDLTRPGPRSDRIARPETCHRFCPRRGPHCSDAAAGCRRATFPRPPPPPPPPPGATLTLRPPSRIGDAVHLPRMRPIPVCENVSGSGDSHVPAGAGHFGVSAAFRSDSGGGAAAGSVFDGSASSLRYRVAIERAGQTAPRGSPGAQPAGQMTPPALFHTRFVIYRASSWGRKGLRNRNRRRIRRGARSGAAGFHVACRAAEPPGTPSDPRQVTLDGRPRQAVTPTLSRRPRHVGPMTSQLRRPADGSSGMRSVFGRAL